MYAYLHTQVEVEVEASGEQEETDGRNVPEAQEFPSAEDHSEASPLEVRGDQTHPGNRTAGLQQHEERRGLEEETHEKPAGGSHPSVSADGEGAASLQDPSKHHEALECQEKRVKDTTEQPEHKEPAVDGGIQAAEEISQPEEPELGTSPPSEVPSQELEDPGIKHRVET